MLFRIHAQLKVQRSQIIKMKVLKVSKTKRCMYVCSWQSGIRNNKYLLICNMHSGKPMLSSWIQSRKLTITIKSILLFQSIKKVHFYVVQIVVPTVDSLRGTGNSDRRFLQLPFFPVFPHTFHPEKTYNLEPPISIYLKNTSLYLHALSVLS